MKCSLGISNFLEEISSLSHSVVSLYFFALISEEGFLISPCYSLELCTQWEYVDILGISKLKWTGMGEFNSDDHYIYYCVQESLSRNGVAIMVNKRVLNAVLGCNLKNDRMISVHFQGKPFNITVIQAYAPPSNAEEAEVEQFYEELQDLLELTPKKRCHFHYRGLECRSRKSRNTWSNR